MMTEAQIKAELDGWFFRFGISRGPEADLVVVATRVNENYIPDHRGVHEVVADPTKPHRNTTPFTSEQDDMIVALREDGWRWADVAKAIGRCIHLTRERYAFVCIQRDIAPAPRRVSRPTRMSEQVKAQMYHMRVAGGMTYPEIGAQLGFSKWQVADAIAAYKKAMKRQAA